MLVFYLFVCFSMAEVGDAFCFLGNKDSTAGSERRFVKQDSFSFPGIGYRRQYPEFADIDADGDLDLFMGHDGHNIVDSASYKNSYYENIGTNGATVYEKRTTAATNPFLNLDVLKWIKIPPCEVKKLGTNVNCAAVSTKSACAAASKMPAVCIGGVDGADPYTADDDGAKCTEGKGKYTAAITGAANSCVFTSIEFKPTLIDLNNDGDLDLIVEIALAAGQSWAHTHYKYWENTGTKEAAVFEERTGKSNNPLYFFEHDDIRAADVLFGLNVDLTHYAPYCSKSRTSRCTLAPRISCKLYQNRC